MTTARGRAGPGLGYTEVCAGTVGRAVSVSGTVQVVPANADIIDGEARSEGCHGRLSCSGRGMSNLGMSTSDTWWRGLVVAAATAIARMVSGCG